MANVFATSDKVVITKVSITAPPAPNVVRIYAQDGSPLDVFPVDAKEIVAGGNYTYDPPVVPETVEQNEQVDLESMTKVQLEAYARDHSIDLTTGMLKADQIEAIRAGGK